MRRALLLVARSIALIERYWHSMKEEYANGFSLFRPLVPIQRDLAAYVEWYSSERPHQGLGGRTPDEAYFGTDTSAKAVPLYAALVAEPLRGDPRLPVLRLRKAA